MAKTRYHIFNDAIADASKTGMPHTLKAEILKVKDVKDIGQFQLQRYGGLPEDTNNINDEPWFFDPKGSRKTSFSEYQITFKLEPKGDYAGETSTYTKLFELENDASEEIQAQIDETLEKILKQASKKKVQYKPGEDNSITVNDYGNLTVEEFLDLYKNNTFTTVPQEFDAAEARSVTGQSLEEIKNYMKFNKKSIFNFEGLYTMAVKGFGISELEFVERLAKKAGVLVMNPLQEALFREDALTHADRLVYTEWAYDSPQGRSLSDQMKRLRVSYPWEIQKMRKIQKLNDRFDNLIKQVRDSRRVNLPDKTEKGLQRLMHDIEKPIKYTNIDEYWSELSKTNPTFDILQAEKALGVSDIRIASSYLHRKLGWTGTTFGWTSTIDGLLKVAKHFRIPEKVVKQRVAKMNKVEIKE